MANWEATLFRVNINKWSRFRELSGIIQELEVNSIRDQFGIARNVSVKGLFHTGLWPKPALSIPFGLYEYYPAFGIFSPAYVNWNDVPAYGLDREKELSSGRQTSAVGVWGISHLTADRSLYAELGLILEAVLAGSPRDVASPLIASLAARLMGEGSGQKTGRFFPYPPFIQAVFDARSAQARSNASVGVKKNISSKELAIVLEELLYDSSMSPLFDGVALYYVRDDKGQIIGNMEMALGDRNDQRLDLAGHPSPTNFSPSLFTALTLSNSESKSVTAEDAVVINAANVLVRDPSAAPFGWDKKQEFPIDGDELKASIEGILDPKNPNAIEAMAGSYGRILLAKMERKQLRSAKFLKALEPATSTYSAPPRTRLFAVVFNKVVKTCLRA